MCGKKLPLKIKIGEFWKILWDHQRGMNLSVGRWVEKNIAKMKSAKTRMLIWTMWGVSRSKIIKNVYL